MSNPALIPQVVKASFGKAGHEDPLKPFGQEIYIKATGEQTGGMWSMIEQRTPPGSGPPMHCHTREDEGFFVLEGKLLLVVGDQEIEANPGDFLWAPRDIPHTFLNIGAVEARAIVVMSPPGLEEFFVKANAMTGQPSREAILALFDEYGLKFLGPPLTPR